MENKNLPMRQTSTTGEKQRIETAKKSKSFALSTKKEIEEVLQHVFFMCGFTNADIPNDIENAVIIDFILNEYPSVKLDEFKLSFRMGIGGKFEIDTALYGKRFSPAYIAKFINGYAKYKQTLLSRKGTEASPYEPIVETPEEKAKIDELINQLKKTYVDPVEAIKKVPARGFGEKQYEGKSVITYEEAQFLAKNINTDKR